MSTINTVVTSLFSIVWYLALSQDLPGDQVRVNQLGYYPDAPKVAVVFTEATGSFELISVETGRSVYEGKLSDIRTSPFSPKRPRIADFSRYNKTGTYFLKVAGAGSSFPFDIRSRVHLGVSKASLKAFYYQRFSTPIIKSFGGKWARPASPSHNAVIVHASAESEKRPAGTTISSERGWIDAGDYNKYIVNSGITTATLLSAYQDFSSYYDTLNVQIPESRDRLPDIINEILWNLRWMMTMQDPADGGVYHKCTNANFDPMVMPDKAISPRYVVQKSTAAALNLAAVCAKASRVLSKFESNLPGLADSCSRAAKSAFQWALEHPDILYNQREMNAKFDPDISTGEYGDRSLEDEFFWAAAELFVSSKDDSYLEKIKFPSEKVEVVPSWNQVALLGYYALMDKDNSTKSSHDPNISQAIERIKATADDMVRQSQQNYYGTVMGGSQTDFVWGSNAVAANQSMLLIKVYRITKDSKYLEAALTNLDYILGRNATGYSYVTGFGDKTPKHPHHRPSEADGVEEPVPGLLVGGPNPGMQDKCNYKSTVPDEAYVDDVCSYASNEVAINWNAPLVYISGAIESIEWALAVSQKKFKK